MAGIGSGICHWFHNGRFASSGGKRYGRLAPAAYALGAPMSRIALYSDKGDTRSSNQDSCCALVANTRRGEVALVVVCDGVGGLERGEVASAMVVRAFTSWFEEDLPNLMRSVRGDALLDSLEQAWRSLLDGLNDSIRAYGLRHSIKLGTTFTGLLAHGDSYLVGHVGDCRAYALREGRVTQLTEDQTLVSHLLAQGKLAPQEASASSLSNVILQSVGTSERLDPAFVRGELHEGDLMLLCSDGAYKTVDEPCLLRTFPWDKNKDVLLEAACRRLVEGARRAGERDNATIACLRWGGGPARGRSVASRTPAGPHDAQATPSTVVMLEGDRR